jgi:hypothetical protein
MGTLSFEGPRFWSEGDERALFDWLERIESVSGVRGQGTTLTLEIREPVSDAALRELIGLFTRYGIEMSDLARFEAAGNREWFRDRGAFWYENVFSPR